MSVRFTRDAEIERATAKQQLKPWELFRSTGLPRALHFARDAGWADKQVQVRVEHIKEDILEYVVEPFESECSCPDILRFDDFFLRPEEDQKDD